MKEYINVQIDYADIKITEQNCLTIDMVFKWEGCGQSIPMYNLGTEYLSKWVRSILETLEITEWAKVKGQYCRILRIDGKIVGIQHIVKDKSFMFDLPESRR